MNTKQGFTLIELLVVVLIIGILASIAIPQYFKVVEKARVAEAQSVLGTIKSAEERYLARAGTYTTNLNDLDISYGAGQDASGVATKFFKTTVALTAGSSSGPGYALTATRHINSVAVATRYGAYAIAISVPDKMQPYIASCPGGGSNCDELVN